MRRSANMNHAELVYGEEFLSLTRDKAENLLQDKLMDVFGARAIVRLLSDLKKIEAALGYERRAGRGQSALEALKKPEMEGAHTYIAYTLIVGKLYEAIWFASGRANAGGGNRLMGEARRKAIAERDKVATFATFFWTQICGKRLKDIPSTEADLDLLVGASGSDRNTATMRGLLAVMDEAAARAEAFKNNRGRQRDEWKHAFCRDLISCWWSFTGKKPTKSRNDTPFNQFINLGFDFVQGPNPSRDVYLICSAAIDESLPELHKQPVLLGFGQVK